MNKVDELSNAEFSQSQLLNLKVEPKFQQIKRQISHFVYSTRGYKTTKYMFKI